MGWRSRAHTGARTLSLSHTRTLLLLARYDQEPVSTQYLAAVHWAMQTVSTVGYGDIRATTTPERLVSVFCMAYGASTWAYVVASVCGIVTSLDPHGTHRKHVSSVPACLAPLFAVQCSAVHAAHACLSAPLRRWRK